MALYRNGGSGGYAESLFSTNTLNMSLTLKAPKNAIYIMDCLYNNTATTYRKTYLNGTQVDSKLVVQIDHDATNGWGSRVCKLTGDFKVGDVIAIKAVKRQSYPLGIIAVMEES